MSRFYFCSSPKFTVRVDVDERGIVTGGAPVIRRFFGQPFENLKRWAKFDRIEKLAPPEAWKEFAKGLKTK